MWKDAGDYIWDFITRQIEDGRSEKEAKEEILDMLKIKIERNEEELMWLRKIRNMIMREEEDDDLCWGEKG